MRSPKQTRTLAAKPGSISTNNTEDIESIRLLTVQECGRITGESPWTWRNRAYAGIVTSVKMAGSNSRLLIPLSEVQRLIAQGTRPAVVGV
jgi:hypothetical protein